VIQFGKPLDSACPLFLGEGMTIDGASRKGRTVT